MLRAFAIAPFLLLLCTLAHSAWDGMSLADAAPKTVAIVNLSAHPSSSAATARARKILDKTPGLRANPPGDLARALEGELPNGGPDLVLLDEAREALKAAEQAFNAFQSNETRTQLELARRKLFALTPSEPATRLLADVSFRMALLHLRDENRGLAMDELQLLHRLDERTSIDPVRYPPDVVRAFNTALRQAPTEKSATLSISATYDGAPIFIDGQPVGAAPLSHRVTAGVHIVAVAAPQYQAAARKIVVDAGATQQLKIDLEPREKTTRALELRFVARQGGLRESDRQEAAERVARLVGTDSVLIICDGIGEAALPSAQLYLPLLERLSYHRPVDAQLGHLFGLLLDVPRPDLIDGGGKPTVVPFYKRPMIVAGFVGVVVVAAFFTFTTNDEMQPTRTGIPSWEF